jgi:hypothetical protein
MAKGSGRTCYDGSEKDMPSFMSGNRDGGIDSRTNQSRYSSSTRNVDDVTTPSKRGTKITGGAYGKGQEYTGPYTDANPQVKPSPDYDDFGNPIGGSSGAEDVTRVKPETENSEDYVRPVYPSRGLSQRLNKK